MQCPFCSAESSQVIDTRPAADAVRRRRECGACGRRFTTSPEYLRSSCRCAGEIQTETIVEKGVVAMSRLVKVIRSHHEISRTRRELNRAISNAATPSMRDELILVAQRAGNVL